MMPNGSKIQTSEERLRKMTLNEPKIRTPEEISKKMLKEEGTIVDLELAVQKEKLKNKKTVNRMLNEEKTIVDLELAVQKEKLKKKADSDKESKTDI